MVNIFCNCTTVIRVVVKFCGGLMMKKLLLLLASMGLVVGLSACNMDRQQTGTIAGAAVGGVVGSHFGSGVGGVAATAGGVLVGGMVGHHLTKDE